MTEARVYRIPADRLPALDAKLGALARRAAKIGVPAPRYEVLDTVEQKELVELVPGEWTETGRTFAVHLVTVIGEAPRYDGWAPVAVIDRDLENPNEPNVVHVIGDTEADVAWRTVGDICDHCATSDGHHVKRGRKKLVVVEHTDSTRKIVGLTCVADFLGGRSPQAIAGWIEALFGLDDLAAIFEDLDGFGSGGGRDFRYDPEAYLAVVVAEIAEHGWLSRGKALDGDATADRAERLFRDRSVGVVQPTYEQHVHAVNALEWALAIDINVPNDYLANVRAVAGKSGWRVRDLGIGASIVFAFNREQDKAREAAAKAAAPNASKHIGAVGERIEITGTVTSSVFYSDDSRVRGGGYTIVRVLTEAGDRVVWFASALAPDEGAKVTGKATVKAHTTFRGEAETKVTRFSWALAGGSMTEHNLTT